MKILTWNINGIRAASKDRPIKNVLDALDADIICLQETKITRDMLDTATAIVDGYTSYFSFSRIKGGYSGVATYCRTHCTPIAAEEGLTGCLGGKKNPTSIRCHDMNLNQFSSQELGSLDAEGRAVLTEHCLLGDSKPVLVINVYCPRASRHNEDRWKYKQMFYRLLQARCEHLLNCEKSVILVGDFNVSHTKLDHCEPDLDPEYFESNESRIWMSNFIGQTDGVSEALRNKCCWVGNSSATSGQYDKSVTGENMETEAGKMDCMAVCENVDAVIGQDDDEEWSETIAGELSNEAVLGQKRFLDLFRNFHPTRKDAFTCWSTVTGARKTNYGTRIDYIIADREFASKFARSCDIRPDIHGSDHCPVEAVLSCEIQGSSRLPDLCTALMPEFRGKQQSITAFVKSSAIGPLRSESIAAPEQEEKGKAATSGVEIAKLCFGAKRKAESQPGKPQKFSKASQRELKRTSSSVKTCCSSGSSNSSIFKSYFTKKKGDTVESSDCKGDNFRQELTPRLPCEIIETENEATDAYHNSAKLVSNAVSDEPLKKSRSANKLHWKSILKGPDLPPQCQGHKEDCVLRTVKKQGSPNIGRQFYCCARPEGRADDKEARCSTFIWKKK
eukprot:gene6263-6983_t